LVAILAAVLGATGMMWYLAGGQAAQETSRSIAEVKARCLGYWQHRSGVADADFEFRNGRKELLQAVETHDPVFKRWTPGLRVGALAETRENYPVSGPSFDGIDLRKIGNLWMLCDADSRYAWDYNVAMLRLLGRERDAELPYVSPELKPR
jgi:hypothetical protein